MYEWSDLRYFLAVARHGSTMAASKSLRVSQSTVHRRLKELERKLGRALVTRHATGYRLTEFGEQMLPHAERVEHAAEGFAHQRDALQRSDLGVIRLTCPEPIMYRITQSALLERFHARHPGLRVEFVMSDKYLDVANGDADVALRSGDTDDDVLVGRKVADSIWAVYASTAYVAKHGRPRRAEDLADHHVVAFDATMAKHRVSQWLAKVAPDAQIQARNNSVLGLVYAVKSGLGVAPLPLPIGDAEPDLVRLFGPVPELARSWRLLTHPRLRKTPRIAAFFDFMKDEADAVRQILTG